MAIGATAALFYARRGATARPATEFDPSGLVAAERDRLATLVRELADAILIAAHDERITLANPAAERLLATGPLVGRRLHEVIREHEILEAVRIARERGTDASADVERLEPSRSVRVLARALPGREILLTMQDLTRVRRLETVRRDFVANVSHELRTPIASLKAMVEALEGGAVSDERAARDFLRRMHGEVDDLGQLVSELLVLSRVESGEDEPRLEPVAVADLVRPAVARLAPLAARSSVSLDVAPLEVPAVRADAAKIGQVLTNLLHNAIKFTPQGGRVEVSASLEDGLVRLRVRDTGVGIHRDEIGRVFERFYKGERSRAGGGTGLGLAIAKHIVQAHGGEIAAASEGPGRGSTFSFTLPAAERP
jgi:two-component system phosphate regulon sensor histidine kinase PhoR